jgi:hypothetical protein
VYVWLQQNDPFHDCKTNTFFPLADVGTFNLSKGAKSPFQNRNSWHAFRSLTHDAHPFACLLYAGTCIWDSIVTAVDNVSGGFISTVSAKFQCLFSSGQAKQPEVSRDGPVLSLIKSLKGLSCRYPNHDGMGVLRIGIRDLESLQDQNYVNDTIIDYQIKWLEQSQRPDTTSSPRMLFCNSFFFRQLCNGAQITPGDTSDPVRLPIILSCCNCSH